MLKIGFELQAGAIFVKWLAEPVREKAASAKITACSSVFGKVEVLRMKLV